jgi:hypothetical protein
MWHRQPPNKVAMFDEIGVARTGTDIRLAGMVNLIIIDMQDIASLSVILPKQYFIAVQSTLLELARQTAVIS